MELKSYLIEKNLSQIKNYSFILLYGENKGLIDELKVSLKNFFNYEPINFFQDELIKNERLLSSEINNLSLFGKNKLIIIHEANDKILSQIKDNFTKTNNVVLVLSNVLDKKSKLRDFFSKEKSCVIIACYNDNERSLMEFIKKELNDFKNLDLNLINLIINNSNSNRRVIKNELQKIKACFVDKKLDAVKINKLLNYRENDDFSSIRDATLNGDKKKLNLELSSLSINNENILLFFNYLSSRLLKLYETRIIEKKCKNIEQALEQLKPKLFWKEKDAFVSQLNKWNLKKINIALINLGKFDKDIKKNFNQINDTMLKQLLINLCEIASSPSKA